MPPGLPEIPREVEPLALACSLRAKVLPALLDTDFLRTAFGLQLYRSPPASLEAARAGVIRLFMAGATLDELYCKIPAFASSLNASSAEIVRLFEDEWLPLIYVVELESARPRCGRAGDVVALDPFDAGLADLAEALAPCILLTHNSRHFKAFGVQTRQQSVHAVKAAVLAQSAAERVQARSTAIGFPPTLAIGGLRWGERKVGVSPWLVGAVVVIGSYVLYRCQSEDRQTRVRQIVLHAGEAIAEAVDREIGDAARAEIAGLSVLGSCMVPGSSQRSAESQLLRELAVAEKSMSAQQLWEMLDPQTRPSVQAVRLRLRGNPACVEVRRGGFTFGRSASGVRP